MGMSRNIAVYNDVARVLDAALAAKGATFTLATDGKARHWCQRAYFYRTLLHEVQALRLGSLGDTHQTVTPYDDMQLRRNGAAIRIEFSVVEGILLDEDGNPLKLSAPKPLIPTEIAGELEPEDLKILAEVKRDLNLEVDDENPN